MAVLHRFDCSLFKKVFAYIEKLKCNTVLTTKSTRQQFYRGSYRSALVLLNLLNELRKSDKMPGLPSILSLFPNKFNKFKYTGTSMLDSIYHDIK